MTTRKYVYLFMVLLIFSNIVKSQIIIQDSVFTTSLDLVESSWDNAIIRNCTFQNTILSDGIRIVNVNNVIIDSCVFYNIEGNGIRLHSSGVSDGVIIKNCTFDSIYGNGVLGQEQHINTQILNNQFNWIGLDTIGASIGQPHHGIYFYGNDFLISGNKIQNIYNNYGNGISVRSNGVVSKNVVSNATKNGIVYYSDHPNEGNNVLIENNIIYNCQRGIRISDGGEPYVDSSVVRFNTVISNDYMCISVGPGLDMNIDIYGNILVRTDGSLNHIWAESSVNESYNVFSDEDIGFLDYDNNDYHITEQSVAYNFATGLSSFPTTDFENDIRNVNRLDAGADQIDNNTGFYPINHCNVLVFPNPAQSEINIVLPSTEIFQITILNLLGKVVKIANNNNKINISSMPKGTYLICIKQGQKTYIKKLIKL
ncbi:MAG: right-handed parallel beta-helix repeat-containing protein [Bacteroidales bacterium]|nr:right-handed parallel beta-helix repeat-containing protein [Bacteroidales bacterium]